MKPDGSLYVMFADCSKNWNAIKTIQSVANGDIKQLGEYGHLKTFGPQRPAQRMTIRSTLFPISIR